MPRAARRAPELDRARGSTYLLPMTMPDTLPEGVKELGGLIQRYHELRHQLTDFLVDLHTDAVQAAVERGELQLEPDAVIDAIREQVDFDADVERFVRAHPELTAGEAQALRDLVRPIGGVFRVDGRTGRLITARNLVDDLDFRLVLGHGEPRELRLYTPGVFVLSAVRPLLDGWILIGEQRFLPASEELLAQGLAARLALEHPRLFFRNPAHLERGFAEQRDAHERFVQRFARPWAVGTAEQVEAWLGELFGRQGTIPADLRRADRIALVSDPRAGQFFVTDLHHVLAAIAAPGRAAEEPLCQALLGLLEDDETPAVLFELLELEHGGGLSPALAVALDRPGFEWGRDGAALLRERRSPAWDPEAAAIPSLVNLSAELRAGLEEVRRREAGPPLDEGAHPG